MFDAIIGWIVAAGVAALALWGVRWKVRADRAIRQIDGFKESSDQWERDAKRKVEEVRRQAAGKAPIDQKNRDEFK